jgi:hypothetical protein
MGAEKVGTKKVRNDATRAHLKVSTKLDPQSRNSDENERSDNVTGIFTTNAKQARYPENQNGRRISLGQLHKRRYRNRK